METKVYSYNNCVLGIDRRREVTLIIYPDVLEQQDLLEALDYNNNLGKFIGKPGVYWGTVLVKYIKSGGEDNDWAIETELLNLRQINLGRPPHPFDGLYNKGL